LEVAIRVCRWLAYFGDPIRPEELLYEPRRSLIEQSRRSGPDAGIANADGFGLGWYGLSDTPGLFRSSLPAWGDQNLRELSAQIRSPLFLAHVRAASAGMPVQQTNCHPFRHGKWLFVHNGFIADWPHLRRELDDGGGPRALPAHRRLDGLRGDVLPRADPSAWTTTRSAPSSGWPASSRRPDTGTAASTRCR
jgi:predicted glutamine amidotransferase